MARKFSAMGAKHMVAAIAALFAAAVHGREPSVEGFKSYTMPGYTIVTHDEVTARRLPPLIVMIDRVLATLVPGEVRVGAVPAYILVVPPRLFAEYLQPEPCSYVCGKFVPGRFVNYILLTDSRDAYWLRRAVFHQYTHFALHTRLRGIQPLWFDEGMAILSERIAFHGPRAIVGDSLLAYPGWLSLEQLLRLERNSPDRRFFSGCSPSSTEMQTSSWALIHRGIVADPDFGKQMFGYLDAINDLKTVDEAMHANFGMSPAELNREMYRYALAYPLKTIRLEVGMFPSETRTPGRKMSELESLELVADAMFASGSARERLLGVINTLQRIAPDSAQVRVLRMRLAAREREDKVIDFLLGKLEASLAEPQIARGVGLALFERVRERGADDTLTTEKTSALQQRALELLDGALRARPDDPEAAWAFGMLAASTKQLQGSALQRLLSASESIPKNADIAMAFALVYESMGKPEKLSAYLQDTARFARSVEQRRWARQRIDSLN